MLADDEILVPQLQILIQLAPIILTLPSNNSSFRSERTLFRYEQVDSSDPHTFHTRIQTCLGVPKHLSTTFLLTTY